MRDKTEKMSKAERMSKGNRILISLLTAILFAGTAAEAQNKIAAPMKDINQVTDLTPDSLDKARTARPVAGSSRKGNNPVLFLVGNSTMRTGTLGNGNNGQWGWGYFAHQYFDENKITVENHALGGTSSRTFYNRLWSDVLQGVRKDDWVIIELGHNDNGPYDSGRARASIPGIGKETLDVTIRETGARETVYTYGEYMRRFIRETKAKGAHPILMSLTPRNAWEDKDSTVIARVNRTFGLWARQVARQERVPFIDLNEITARKFEKFGKEKVKYMFYLDRIHTSVFGARVNAASAAEGIREYRGLRLASLKPTDSLKPAGSLKLADFLKPQEKDTLTGATRRPGCPVVFTVGDSTVRNADTDENGQWGWGSVLAELFDPERVSVENCAKAGRSARTYLEEGRWDKVYNALQPGDFVLIQFGHNDAGPIHTGKVRAELPGAGDESRVFLMEATRTYNVVYTFGWYLRKFVMDVQEKGAVPILLSHTPRNIWDNGQIQRNSDSFGKWTKEAAEATGAYYIDLNKLTGDKLQELGYEHGLRAVGEYFCRDHTHTSLKGARLNARSIAEGLLQTGCPLGVYLK